MERSWVSDDIIFADFLCMRLICLLYRIIHPSFLKLEPNKKGVGTLFMEGSLSTTVYDCPLASKGLI